jgi:hypothetical protein
MAETSNTADGGATPCAQFPSQHIVHYQKKLAIDLSEVGIWNQNPAKLDFSSFETCLSKAHFHQ